LISSVRFGFLEQKQVQTGLTLFFLVWLGFFLFGFGSARLDSVFLFQAYKIEPVGFFKILIGFFSRFDFFNFFFLGLIGFLIFLFTTILLPGFLEEKKTLKEERGMMESKSLSHLLLPTCFLWL
jgi:hypothetical protein